MDLNRKINPDNELKEIFHQLNILLEFFICNGTLLEIKSNQFFSVEKFEAFRSSIIVLKALGIIKPIIDTEVVIYLDQNNELVPQFKEVQRFLLTNKGQDLLNVLPKEV